MKINLLYLSAVLLVTITSCDNSTPSYLKNVQTVTYEAADSSGRKYVFTDAKKDSAVKYFMSLESPEHTIYIFSSVGHITLEYNDGSLPLTIETNGRMLGPINTKYYRTRKNSTVPTAMDSIAAGKAIGKDVGAKGM